MSHGAPPNRIDWERLVETPSKPSHNNLFLDWLSPQRALLCYLLDKFIHTVTLGACNIKNPQLKIHNLTLTPPHGGIHRIKHLISSEWGSQAHRHPHTVKALLKSHTGQSYLGGGSKGGGWCREGPFPGSHQIPLPPPGNMPCLPALVRWVHVWGGAVRQMAWPPAILGFKGGKQPQRPCRGAAQEESSGGETMLDTTGGELPSLTPLFNVPDLAQPKASFLPLLGCLWELGC